MNDTNYGHGERYSIQHNSDRYDGDIDYVKEHVYENENIAILSCVSHWPEFKIRIEKDKSGFDRPDVAFILFQQRMEAMKFINKKKTKHSDRWRDLFQDDDGEKSNIVDNKDTSSFLKLKLQTRKICSIESVNRLFKFVKSNN
jgi:hypothetical protein